ncbi:terminase small subunit [Pasteurella multocida]|uniref:terminase small subunit-like protein n=1 Tax=Pasteurella multocida TaxID=747 RepID=UPI002341AF78|nr:terminase small subunit [Pasteurella multocida]MDC4238340.1 terminase small subunit [Pasteurella multocida]
MPKKDEVKSTSKGRGENNKKKTGRPSSYMQEVADDICMLLSQGESLTKICERQGFPPKKTVLYWLRTNSEFRTQYAYAREMQTEAMLEDLFTIADSATPEDVQVAKLRVDARKWAMSRLAPKKYGDKVTQEISGVDGSAVKIEMKKEIDLSVYSDDELRLLRELKRKQP